MHNEKCPHCGSYYTEASGVFVGTETPRVSCLACSRDFVGDVEWIYFEREELHSD